MHGVSKQLLAFATGLNRYKHRGQRPVSAGISSITGSLLHGTVLLYRNDKACSKTWFLCSGWHRRIAIRHVPYSYCHYARMRDV